jgi:tetratricopeptide (TPR) repeat protein
MKIPEPLIQKALPLLLVASAAVFLLNDRLFLPGGRPAKPAPPPIEMSGGENAGHARNSHGGHDDHDDPEKNRRMGIFHYNAGNRDLAGGKLEAAVDNYKMALSHNENFVETYVNLSTTYLKARRFGEARDTLNRLEQIAPDNPQLHYNRACLHSLEGDTQNSLSALAKAVDLGYGDQAQIETDPDLKRLRTTGEYRRFIGELGSRQEKSGQR